MSFNLLGKRVILTGATGGIGSAIAKCLVNSGVNLVISGTNEEKLTRLNSELGNKANIIQCDLSNLDAAGNLISKAAHSLGGLDGLICNAGITDDKLGIRMSLESWQKVINLNLTSTFLLNKNGISEMLRGGGSIVNISSVVGSSGNAGQANYAASKAGVVAMTKSLAIEYARKGVRINCIAPGFIKSDMTDKLTDEQKSAILQNIPMAKMGNPEDLWGVIALLLSDLSKYITGQTFHVNGGMLMP